ncbi:hypothetical protein [Nocardioides sp. WS12]|uniref:hypothetical protein n=1 Tax=Nocardioides sp. WS12 TaxID=2486272 RepID=UPI0015FD6813|nr:hypothetical protein [Nocardioides sp. WS12]
MIGWDLDTWISLAVLVTALTGFYVALRRELHAEISGLRGEMADLRVDLKADINRLDDRVYALASGMRPHLEKSDRPASS